MRSGFCSDTRQKQSFVEKLERMAQEISHVPDKQFGHLSISSIVQDDITLLLDQIAKHRTLKREIMHSLLQSECYVETELIQMEERTPRYSPNRFPEREKLQRRLGSITQERRRFTMNLAEKLDSFHDRLLSLLKKHRHLKPKQLKVTSNRYIY